MNFLDAQSKQFVLVYGSAFVAYGCTCVCCLEVRLPRMHRRIPMDGYMLDYVLGPGFVIGLAAIVLVLHADYHYRPGRPLPLSLGFIIGWMIGAFVSMIASDASTTRWHGLVIRSDRAQLIAGFGPVLGMLAGMGTVFALNLLPGRTAASIKSADEQALEGITGS